MRQKAWHTVTVEVGPREPGPAEVQRKGLNQQGAVEVPSEAGHQTGFHPVGAHSLAEANQMREEELRTPAEGRRMPELGLRTKEEGSRSLAEELHMREEELRTMEVGHRRRPVAAVADRRGTFAQGVSS